MRSGEWSKRGFAATAATPQDVYDRLLSLDLRHDYYGSKEGGPGPCSDLALEPTAHTAERLARFGMLLRGRRDGFDILMGLSRKARLARSLDELAARSSGTATDEMLQDLIGGPLVFTLHIIEPRFLNVTDLPWQFGSGEAALCLSNRRVLPAAGGAAAIEIDSARNIPLEIVTHEWMLANKREMDEEARAEAIASRPLPDAWCRTAEGEAPMVEAAGGARDPRITRLPLAYVEIFLTPPPGPGGSDETGSFAITATDPDAMKVTPVRYEIRFAARATKWRYVVADRSGKLLDEKLSVEDLAEAPASRVAFNPGDTAPKIPGVVRAYTFLSDVALPLRHWPDQRFVLRGKTSSAPRREPRLLVDPLPSPAADSTPRRGRGGAADVSEILVFV